MTGDDDFNMLDPKNVLKVNVSPVQRPGTDRLIRTAIVGGPEKEGDRRVYLSVELLTKFLEVARSSPMRRVEVTRAGVRVDLYLQASGHQYETWTLIGANPKPEQVPQFIMDTVNATKADS